VSADAPLVIRKPDGTVLYANTGNADLGPGGQARASRRSCPLELRPDLDAGGDRSEKTLTRHTAAERSSWRAAPKDEYIGKLNNYIVYMIPAMETGMSAVITGYLVRDKEDWANPDPRRAVCAIFALHGIGLSDARYEARERSQGGKHQVIVKIADHDEVIIEEYVDGQRQ